MVIKFTFFKELKKYSKTVCLMLALGGASAAGVAQCPPEASYHEPEFTFSVSGKDFFHNSNPGTGRITIKMNLQCYGQFYTFYDDCPNHKADGVNINNLPVKIIAHCRKSDNTVYKTEEILRPVKGEHTFDTFTGLPYGNYVVNVSLVVPGSHTLENVLREFQGTPQTTTLIPPTPQISFPSENANYGNGSVLGVNVNIPQGSDGINMADIEVKCVLLKGKKNPTNWSESDPAYSIWNGLLYPNCGTYNFCNGGFTFPSQWEGKTVKLIAHIKNSDIYSTPVYVTVGTPNEYDEPEGAIATQSNEKPSIVLDFIKNCYREGNTVNVPVFNINTGDKVELHYCRLAYESRNVNCPVTTPDNIDKFKTAQYTANSSSIQIPIVLQASQNWRGKTLKIIAHNITKGTRSNEFYIDVRKKDTAGISYLTACDYTKAFDNTNSFNWRFAYWCGKTANASYGNNNATMDSLGFEIIHSDTYFNVKYDIGKKIINGTNYVMISFRGTVWENLNNQTDITNALIDISTARINWKNKKVSFTPCFSIEDFDKNPETSLGFYLVTDEIMAVFNNVLWWNNLGYNNCKFIVTGHSLGGAIAELFTLKLAPKVDDKNKIICYSFASLNVADKDLKKYAKDEIPISNRIHRLKNSNDGVLGIVTSLTNNCFNSSIAGDEQPFSKIFGSGDYFNHSMEKVYLKHLKKQALLAE